MKKIVTLCAVVGASALLAACSSNQTDNNIVGSYLLVSVNDQPIPNAIPPVLNITQDSSVTNIQLNGKMCNIFNGQAIYQNGVLQAADGVAMTRVFCNEPTLNQLDTVIGDMLSKGANVEKVNGKLVLKSGNNTLVYQQQNLPMTQKDNTK
ncbi:META domain-containing protein [Orbus wheelerorum]|uniref:META domain-containing protein n=1 Tax=Orbus wheelerorum TaxID=3074111 RepID=UPI00370DCF9F